MHTYGCFSASKSATDWCKLMYTYRQVQFTRIYKYNVYTCITYSCLGTSKSDWCKLMHTYRQVQFTRIYKYYVYACTTYSCLGASKSDWCKLMYMHTQSTAVWAITRVIDASWCICMHEVQLFKVIDASWCTYIDASRDWLMQVNSQELCVVKTCFCCMCSTVLLLAKSFAL